MVRDRGPSGRSCGPLQSCCLRSRRSESKICLRSSDTSQTICDPLDSIKRWPGVPMHTKSSLSRRLFYRQSYPYSYDRDDPSTHLHPPKCTEIDRFTFQSGLPVVFCGPNFCVLGFSLPLAVLTCGFWFLLAACVAECELPRSQVW